MASHLFQYMIPLLTMLTLLITPSYTQLTPFFYDKVCSQALPIIFSVVQRSINHEPRMGASLLRLHFHDCFVNGCDGSVLLDDTANFTGEKRAPPNLTLRGFNVIDEIKEAVDKACNGHVVSCADILAVAARDSISILGGQAYWYEVLLGRRDSRSTSKQDATSNFPAPLLNFSQILSNFESHGLGLKDLVALAGAHTIGYAHCSSFRDRIYNDSNIDPKFASSLKLMCPKRSGNNNLVALDATPTRFDNEYFKSLLRDRGILPYDGELFTGNYYDGSSKLVQLYSQNPFAFANDFKASMIKMGNLKPRYGTAQEIRINCRSVN